MAFVDVIGFHHSSTKFRCSPGHKFKPQDGITQGAPGGGAAPYSCICIYIYIYVRFAITCFMCNIYIYIYICIERGRERRRERERERFSAFLH